MSDMTIFPQPEDLSAVVRAYLYSTVAYVRGNKGRDADPQAQAAARECFKTLLHDLVWSDDWEAAAMVTEAMDTLREIFLFAGEPLTSD